MNRSRSEMKKAMTVFLIILAVAIAAIALFINQPQFGKLPTGERLAKIEASPNYKNGEFQNLSPTPQLTEGATYWSITKEFIFNPKPRANPSVALPSQKHDLSAIPITENVAVWFGHSSYYLQLDGKRILVDPVFSGNASPLSFTTKAFDGTDRYAPDDMPNIDFLFISHDHWDHLDYRTIIALKPKIGRIVCALGVGQHFEYWGFDAAQIEERDWNEDIVLGDGFTVRTAPARHFSGRGLARNKSLWTSFVLKTPSFNIYLGGDSGYDAHFAEIGQAHGPFDLAILENGQYDRNWKHIHMMPEEVVLAAQELRATRLLPVHSAKFPLSNHDWDDPLRRVSKAAENAPLQLLTPVIGEVVYIGDSTQVYGKWWEGVN